MVLRVMTSSRMKKPWCMYIFSIIWGARLCRFHLGGEKAGDQRKSWVGRDLWRSGWTEDPNPSHGWTDFQVRSGSWGLCPENSDISKGKGSTYQPLWAFSITWPSESWRIFFLTSKQISQNLSFCLGVHCLSSICCAQEATGSIFPVTIRE